MFQACRDAKVRQEKTEEEVKQTDSKTGRGRHCPSSNVGMREEEVKQTCRGSKGGIADRDI